MNKQSKTFNIDGSDIFAILVPGIIVTVSLIVAVLAPLNTNLISELTSYAYERDSELTYYFAVAATLLLASYIIGQMAASISVIIFDRIIVDKIIGYPYKMALFKDVIKNDDKYQNKSNFYRSLIFLFACLILLYCIRDFDPLQKLISDFHCYNIIYYSLLFLVLMKVFDPLLIKYNVFLKRKKYYNLRILDRSSHESRGISNFGAKVYRITSRPAFILENVIRKAWNFDEPLSKHLIDKFMQAFETIYS